MKRSIALLTALLLASCGSEGGEENQQARAAESATVGAGGGGGGGGGVGAAMQPGLWETQVEIAGIEIPNMPAGMAPPKQAAVTTRACLTAEQLSAQNPGTFTSGGDNSTCRSENFSMSGGRMQGTVQCDVSGNQTRVEMDGRFSATSFELNQQIETNAGGTATRIDQRITGRRVGDCPG